MSNIFIVFVVYIFLVVLGIKFYLWSRRQEKKYNIKWRRRLGNLLFWSPVILFILQHFSFLPSFCLSIIYFLIQGVDWTLRWFQQNLEPVLGFLYYFLKPIIAALVYAVFGILIGWPLDEIEKKKEDFQTERKIQVEGKVQSKGKIQGKQI